MTKKFSVFIRQLSDENFEYVLPAEFHLIIGLDVQTFHHQILTSHFEAIVHQ